jgi:hypothetical protein
VKCKSKDDYAVKILPLWHAKVFIEAVIFMVGFGVKSLSL